MVQFINDLENLREELYDNSKEILNLLEERKKLANKIGKYKDAKKLNIRNREREIEILKNLAGNQYRNIILNILFEFSIHYEQENHEISPVYSININGIKYAEFRSHRENLVFILSRIINPGSLIHCHSEMMCRILTASGHHIVDSIENPDLTIYMDGRNNQDIILTDSSLLISEKFFDSKDNIYSIEMV